MGTACSRKEESIKKRKPKTEQKTKGKATKQLKEENESSEEWVNVEKKGKTTQGTTKEGDKDYIVRVSMSPNLDLERHKNVFLQFVGEI